MKLWIITYSDKEGVQQQLELGGEQRPTEEEVADYLRELLFPIADEVTVPDLDGRVPEPMVKSLKEQHGVQILSITPAP
ncbi:hypothetical protein [Pseudomonas sp. NA-150]|uniref:hypothetical protein n=1 Tax=Pseudomonas sp. NA-150 TaxID=3367525 RepID=UPI0037C8572D